MSDSSARSRSDAVATRRWTERLERFAAGHHTIVAFCAAEGVSQSNFYLWRRRLAQPVPPPSVNTATVVPLRVAPSPAPSIELALPSGATLRFPADVRPEMLVVLLRGLRCREWPRSIPPRISRLLARRLPVAVQRPVRRRGEARRLLVNDLSERTLRLIAVGRSNWKFVGSAKAGERAAVHFSVVGTCRHLGLDAAAYLREVLPALHALGEKPTDDQLAVLLPDAWAKRQQPRLVAA